MNGPEHGTARGGVVSKGKVVHVNGSLECDYYIGRANRRYGLAASDWANPYRIGWDGSRQEILQKYLSYLAGNAYLARNLFIFEGKVLGCWCPPKGEALTADDPWVCHGQVILWLLENGTLVNGSVGEER